MTSTLLVIDFRERALVSKTEVIVPDAERWTPARPAHPSLWSEDPKDCA